MKIRKALAARPSLVAPARDWKVSRIESNDRLEARILALLEDGPMTHGELHYGTPGTALHRKNETLCALVRSQRVIVVKEALAGYKESFVEVFRLPEGRR